MPVTSDLLSKEVGIEPGKFDFSVNKLQSIISFANLCEGKAVASHPLEVFLEVSNLCDLKCVMCRQFSALNAHRYEQLRSQDRGFLDTVGIADNLKGALDGALLVHCFGFGEPTIHPSFRAIIEEVTRHGCMTDFYTNGMHLDQDLCDFLVESSVAQIIISFSGAEKEIYENIYIGGKFEQVLAGIKRLSEAKKKRNSPYPVIHINSIGFEDHIARFDAFVELMAAHGADVVFLRKLDVHPNMPHLFEHVSIMGPGKETEILRRAQAAAIRLGVRLDVDLYVRHAAVDEVDHIFKEAALREAVHSILQNQDRIFGGTKLRDFQEIARTTPVAPARGKDRPPPSVLDLDADPTLARDRLRIAAPAAAEPGQAPFHCMEPFKTLYVTRNGPVKPCCFANTDWFLGDVKTSDAGAIWRGQGFTTVRGAIAQGEYPDFCSGCINNKSAPEYTAGSLVEMYLSWHEAKFKSNLRVRLEQKARGARQVIMTTPPAQIMTALRSKAG